MKKALAIFLAVTMLLVSLVSLAACGNKKEVETKNEDESADQTIDLSKTLPHEYIQEKLDAGQEVIVAYAATTFDNGTATINTEICAQLGLDFDTVSGLFAPYCTKINSITTAEYFD